MHSGWIVLFPIHSNRSKMNIARCRSNRDPIEEILTYLASKAWCKVPTVEFPGIVLLHLLPEGMTCGITYKHSTDPLLDQRKSIQRIRRTCRVSAGKHGPHICTSQSMVKRKVAPKTSKSFRNQIPLSIEDVLLQLTGCLTSNETHHPHTVYSRMYSGYHWVESKITHSVCVCSL